MCGGVESKLLKCVLMASVVDIITIPSAVSDYIFPVINKVPQAPKSTEPTYMGDINFI